MVGLDHMCYFDTVLDHGSILRLLDCLQNDYPIRSMAMFFDLGGVILGGLIPIAGSTVSSVPTAVSRKISLNLSHRSTTRLSLWEALISLLL